MNLLFVCSQNVARSPTAEQVFTGVTGVQAASAGTDEDAVRPITAEIARWADAIFVMETHHLEDLQARFAPELAGKEIFVLHIPDNYDYLGEELVQLLLARVEQALEGTLETPTA